jgi:HD-like signal output (HDOD) protein
MTSSTLLRLPVQPLIAAAVVRHARSASSSPDMVTRLVEADPSMALAVLRMANAPYYGASRRVSSVRQAVVMLGSTTVTSLAMSGTASLVVSEEVEYRAPMGFWSHGLVTAIACRVIAQRRGGVKPEDAYTVGLIHDVGALSAFVQHPDNYERLFPAVPAMPRSGPALLDAETLTFGSDHAESGAALLAQWNLPEVLVQAVRSHHATNDTGLGTLARILIAGHAIGTAVDPTGCRAVGPFPPSVLVPLGIAADRFDQIVDVVSAELAESAAFLTRQAP